MLVPSFKSIERTYTLTLSGDGLNVYLKTGSTQVQITSGTSLKYGQELSFYANGYSTGQTALITGKNGGSDLSMTVRGSLTVEGDVSLNCANTWILYTLIIKYEGTPETIADHTETLQYNAAYSVASPLVDGYTPSQTSVSGKMPDSDLTVTVTYTVDRYDLTFTAGAGTRVEVSGDGISGSAVPGTPLSLSGVAWGTDITVKVSTETGYSVPKLQVGSASVALSSDGTYTFKVLPTTTGISSSATKTVHTVTTSAARHTTITPDRTTATYGDTVVFEVTAEEGYTENLEVYANGTRVSGVNGRYSVSMPDGDLEIKTITSISQYEIVFNIGEHTYMLYGTEKQRYDARSESYTFTYNHGQRLVFTILPETGYDKALRINGVSHSGTGYNEPVTKGLTITSTTSANLYTVTWVYTEDGGGSVKLFQKDDVPYGTTVNYDGTPNRASSDRYDYTFKGWSPVEGPITGDTTYYAIFDQADRKYTIVWKNDDGTQLKTDSVAYGSTPSYTGDTPTKGSTAEYRYAFSGWSPEIVPVTSDATYTAQYTSEKMSYTVTWKNTDGTVLKADTVEYGGTPSYGGTPTRAPDKDYTYEFKGWSSEVVPVTGDATYTAQYDSIARTFAVTFESLSTGSFSCTQQTTGLSYGTTVSFTIVHATGYTPSVVYRWSGDGIGSGSAAPEYDSATGTYTLAVKGDTHVGATMEANQYLIYVTGEGINVVHGTAVLPKDAATTLRYNDVLTITVDEKAGHTRGVSAAVNGAPVGTVVGSDGSYTYTVVGNATISSVYTPIGYTITWVPGNGIDSTSTSTVWYGDSPDPPAVTQSYRTPEFTYTFSGWDPKVVAVTGEATYTAQYTATKNSYTVTLLNWDGTVFNRLTKEYGSSVSDADLGTPRRAPDVDKTYRLSGWTTLGGASVAFPLTVTEDVTLKSVFSESVRSYTITWDPANGGAVEKIRVAYGTVPTVPSGLASPEKQGDDTVRYVFSSWSPSIAAVVGDATYTAQYTVLYPLTFEVGANAVVSDVSDNPDLTIRGGTASTVWFAEGSTIRFKASATEGYVVETVSNATAMQDGLHRITLDSAKSVQVTAKRSTFDITFSPGPNTSFVVGGREITTSTPLTYEYGTVVTYVVRAADGYTQALTLDGYPARTGDEHSLTVSRDQEVRLSTEADRYTITFTDTYLRVFRDGSAVANGSEIRYGETLSLSVGVRAGMTSAVSCTNGGSSYDVSAGSLVVKGRVVLTVEWAVAKYTITWQNWDGTQLGTSEVEHGQYPVYIGQVVPTRAADAQYTYSFNNRWSPEVKQADGNTTYVAVFDTTVNRYTVTWMNGTTELYHRTYAYGETPQYRGDDPTKDPEGADAYVFSGWRPAVSEVRGDQAYTAVFDVTVRMCAIELRDSSSVAFEAVSGFTGATVPYGTAVTFRASVASGFDASALKVFANTVPLTGSGDLYTVTVEGDTVITGSADPSEFIVEIDGNGRDGVTVYNRTAGADVPNGGSVHFGDVLKVTIAFREGYDAGLTASSGTIGSDGSYTVGSNVRFIGTYTVKTYTITWKDWDGRVIRTDALSYGSVPSAPTGLTRASSDKTDYALSGWSPSVTAVTGDAVYTAAYSETARLYTITWKNWDGSVLYRSSVAYGDRPTDGDFGTPIKASDRQYNYRWSAWALEGAAGTGIQPVTGDATYVAEFRAVPIMYTIAWVDWNGTTLKTLRLGWNAAIPEYGGTPTRAADAEYTYVFSGWSPEHPDTVDGNLTYTARYTATVREYTVVFDESRISVVRAGASGDVAVSSGVSLPYGTTVRAVATSVGTAVPYLRVNGGAETPYAMSHTVVSDIEITVADYTGSYVVTADPGVHVFWNGSELSLPSYQPAGVTLTVAIDGRDGYLVRAMYGGTVLDGSLVMPAAPVHISIEYVKVWRVVYDPSEVRVVLPDGSVPASGDLIPEGTVLDVDPLPMDGYVVGLEANGVQVNAGGYTLSSDVTFVRTSYYVPVYYVVTFVEDNASLSNLRVNAVVTVPDNGKVTVLEGSVLMFNVVLGEGCTDPVVTVAASSSTRTLSASAGTYMMSVTEDAVITVSATAPAPTPEPQPTETWTVRWLNWDGTALETSTVADGTVPVYGGDAPSRDRSEHSSYVFAGWDPAVVAVTQDAVYTAVFTEVPDTFTVAIEGEGVTVMNGAAALSSGDAVPYGTVLSVNIAQIPGYVAAVVASPGAIASDGTYRVVSDVTFTGSYAPVGGGDDDDHHHGFPWWILLLLLIIVLAAYLAYRHHKEKEEMGR